MPREAAVCRPVDLFDALFVVLCVAEVRALFLCVAAPPDDESLAGFAGVFGVDVKGVTEESANEGLPATIRQTTIKHETRTAVLLIARVLAPIPTRFEIVFRIQ